MSPKVFSGSAATLQAERGRVAARFRYAYSPRRVSNVKGHRAMRSVTFILTPGAGGSAWYWHLVAPKLRQRGHEGIPVALPAADDTAGLPDYAATVVRAIGSREPQRVVLVAQSLAGFTAPLVCKQVSVA